MSFICSDPSTITISKAVNKVKSGKWTLAAFQRPKKWTWIEQKSLLESLLHGVPIGNVYLWENVLFMRRKSSVLADSRDDGNGNRIDENDRIIA